MQQLANEAVQEIRIKNRWNATEQDNKAMDLAKEEKKPWLAEILENGYTLKQLLARSRYLLFKKEVNWIPFQNHRAEHCLNDTQIYRKPIRFRKNYLPY